eukprot:jgi/Mesvir1/9126/Mv07830-RA.1
MDPREVAAWVKLWLWMALLRILALARLSMSVVYGYGGRETAVLSATLGRCSPHPDDKDITDALSAFLGPDRDFYASAGLPQYIWCIIRHIGIDAIVAGASKPGSDQADVQDEFMRVIYGSGECLLFHPKAGGVS